jgi:RimJ/RimL family protein N-acetyltransferase
VRVGERLLRSHGQPSVGCHPRGRSRPPGREAIPINPWPFRDELLSTRLRLRRFVTADAAALSDYRSDPATAALQSWSAPFSMGAAEAFIREVAAVEPGAPGDAFQYAIERRDQPGLIGDLMLRIDEDPRLAEVGFTVAPAHRGQGFATEALGAVLDHVLVDPGGVHRVEARCDARNGASTALLRRVGMRQEGHLVEAVFSKGEWTDDLIFAVLAREWRQPG